MTAGSRGPGGTGTGGDAAKIPRPITAGPEMTALSRFYRDVTWEGVIREGGMGPGTPAMTGTGRATARAIQDGRWIVLDCEQEQLRGLRLQRPLPWANTTSPVVRGGMTSVPCNWTFPA